MLSMVWAMMVIVISLKRLYMTLRLHLHGTSERFCMEPSALVRIGFPFTRSLGTVLCRTVSFKAFAHEQFKTTASLSIYQEHEKFLKKISHYTFVLRNLAQRDVREQIFQLSSAILSRISPCLVSKRT